MLIKQLSVALPNSQNTGWGLAGRRITEELKKLTLCSDLNGTGILERPFPTTVQGNLLQAISGVECLPQYSQVSNTEGDFHTGICFIEQNLLMRQYLSNLHRQFNAVITGSAWAYEQMLEAVRLDRHFRNEFVVARAIQGVDQDIFCPVLEPQTDPKWFTVLSAGKFEWRKSQDVVIAAIRVMMERHKDVRLLASWWNPWPESAKTMERSRLINCRDWQLPGSFDSMQSCVNRSMDGTRVELLGETPHAELPSVYRRADVALFPNRAEAGTNLPLMEAASCGVPIIATVQHGHADVRDAIGFKLVCGEWQDIVEGGMLTARWWEPELEEVIVRLEQAYQFWGCGLAGYGVDARKAIAPFTWKSCAESILEVF